MSNNEEAGQMKNIVCAEENTEIWTFIYIYIPFIWYKANLILGLRFHNKKNKKKRKKIR